MVAYGVAKESARKDKWVMKRLSLLWLPIFTACARAPTASSPIQTEDIIVKQVWIALH